MNRRKFLTTSLVLSAAVAVGVPDKKQDYIEFGTDFPGVSKKCWVTSLQSGQIATYEVGTQRLITNFDDVCPRVIGIAIG